MTVDAVIKLILKVEPGTGPELTEEMTTEVTGEGVVDTITVKVPPAPAAPAAG